MYSTKSWRICSSGIEPVSYVNLYPRYQIKMCITNFSCAKINTFIFLSNVENLCPDHEVQVVERITLYALKHFDTKLMLPSAVKPGFLP